jgi:NAD(P)-dependent dehydrogenase (short-subunit alcohol dehydrogenase family)
MGVLDGKVAIITGGASGIGKGMATAVAKEGAGVTITDINVDLVATTAENLRSQDLDVLDVVADGRKDEDVANAVQRTVDKWGRIDMLINCAQAAHQPKPFEEWTVDDLSLAFDSGFFASLRYMNACFPYLKESQGSVLNFGSQAGLIANAGQVDYNAAKEAIRAMSRTAAREWGQYNIAVNNIIPGMLTEGMKSFFEDKPEHRAHSLANIPMGRFGDPEKDAGSLAVFLMTEGAHFFTGDTFNLDGGRVLRP